MADEDSRIQMKLGLVQGCLVMGTKLRASGVRSHRQAGEQFVYVVSDLKDAHCHMLSRR